MADVEHRPAITLLGPVEVRGPSGTASLVGPRQRALVAVLALSSGSVVSQARLVDALWGDDPPRTAVRTLQSHVARVRVALEACGLPGVLRTRDPGYFLDLDANDVDARRAAALARAGDPIALAAALELWDGDPLCDVGEGDWVMAERERLVELRLTIAEDLFAHRLAAGEHRGAVAELEELVAAAPIRERLVALLMLALYRCGRHADALDRFRRLQTVLADELGIDPTPEVAQLHGAILRHDRALDLGPAQSPAAQSSPAQSPAAQSPAPCPRELPPPGGQFTGRAEELDALERAGDAVRVVIGQGGVGKTALAVRWAHAVKQRYPDGQVFLDLRGHDPDVALPPVDALIRVLRSLGIPPDQIPATMDEQLRQYRAMLDGRRMLIVLDNAGTADHVLPLVPPTASSVLVVTSRRRLTALALHHEACLVELDVLTPGEARAVLAGVLGAGRVEAEPRAVAALVDTCGRLPLALRIAAARLAGRPRQLIADLLEELSEGVLSGLAIEGDERSVRSVYLSAFNGLSEPAAALFARLGRHPGPSFTAHLAAALAGSTVGRVRRSVDELAAAHLISEHSSGRYRFHDLIRAFALECPDERGGAELAVIDWHVAVAAAANRALGSVRTRVQPDTVAVAPFAEEPSVATAFLDAERDNHLPVVAAAARARPDLACALVYLLSSYYSRRCHIGERLALCRAGIDASLAVDDSRELEALLRNGLGIALIAARRYEDAIDELRLALPAAQAGGQVDDEAGVQNNLAVAYGELGSYAEAAAAFGHIATLVAGTDPVVEAEALNNLGFVLALSGADGVPPLERALELATRAGHRLLRAEVLDGLGHAYRAAGDSAQALDHLRQAVAEFRDLDDHARVPDVLATIGLVLLDDGAAELARVPLLESLELSRAAGDAHVEQKVSDYLARADDLLAQAVTG